MTRSDDGERYSDKQVALILRRAANLQAHGQDAPRKTGGFSLADLEEIALEAGIDPANIRRAAEELNAGGLQGSSWDPLLGSPLTVRVERSVAGEISPDRHDDLLAEIQRSGLGHGKPAVVGQTLTWSTDRAQNTSSTQITVSVRNGRTEIRAEERRHQAAVGLFAGIMAGGGVGVGLGVGVPIAVEVLQSPAAAFVLPVAGVAAAFGLARTIFSRTGRRREAKLRGLVDRLAGIVSSDTDRPALASESEDP